MFRKSIKLGVAATRRNIFSREDAIRHKNIILQRLSAENIDCADLESLNEDGLLYDITFCDAAAEHFIKEKIDALFIPHCNFGCEEAVSNLAKRLGVPVLLWGPRDNAPLENGQRLRDSQCGLFATGKVLLRMNVPFTYIANTWIDGDEWVGGVKNFIGAVSVVKAMKSLKIGQIGTRPRDFFSVICNEGELIEKFGIQVIPMSLADFCEEAKKLIAEPERLKIGVNELKAKLNMDFPEEEIRKLAAIKKVMADWAEENSLSAIAIQCWNALQDILGVMPCAVNACLSEEGLPVVCETDINGAVSAVIAQAAGGYEKPVFFADITVRHSENDNAELLWHCGPFPPSLRKKGTEANVLRHSVLPSKCPGVCDWELEHGEVTVVRFDGIGGKYSLLAANGKGVDGPVTRGTYLWTEFADWEALERKIVCGPYIHHVAGIYGNIIPVLEEALRYIPGLEADFVK